MLFFRNKMVKCQNSKLKRIDGDLKRSLTIIYLENAKPQYQEKGNS